MNIIGPNRGASTLLQNEEESTRIPLVRHKPCPWFAVENGGAGRDEERRRPAAFSPDAHLAFHPRHHRVKCRVGPRARCVSFSLGLLRSVVSRGNSAFPTGGPRASVRILSSTAIRPRSRADLTRSRSRTVNHRPVPDTCVKRTIPTRATKRWRNVSAYSRGK